MPTNSEIAKLGEDAAVEYLQGGSYSVVGRNYELPMGEIDIIAKKSGKLYFVEVKASLDTHQRSFSPEERVDKRKRQRLQTLCETYLMREGINASTPWQLDIIAVTLDKEGKNPHIRHIENAIWDQRGV